MRLSSSRACALCAYWTDAARVTASQSEALALLLAAHSPSCIVCLSACLQARLALMRSCRASGALPDMELRNVLMGSLLWKLTHKGVRGSARLMWPG